METQIDAKEYKIVCIHVCGFPKPGVGYIKNGLRYYLKKYSLYPLGNGTLLEYFYRPHLCVQDKLGRKTPKEVRCLRYPGLKLWRGYRKGTVRKIYKVKLTWPNQHVYRGRGVRDDSFCLSDRIGNDWMKKQEQEPVWGRAIMGFISGHDEFGMPMRYPTRAWLVLRREVAIEDWSSFSVVVVTIEAQRLGRRGSASPQYLCSTWQKGKKAARAGES